MVAAPNIVSYFTLIGSVQLAGATVSLMSPTVERVEWHYRQEMGKSSTHHGCGISLRLGPSLLGVDPLQVFRKNNRSIANRLAAIAPVLAATSNEAVCLS